MPDFINIPNTTPTQKTRKDLRGVQHGQAQEKVLLLLLFLSLFMGKELTVVQMFDLQYTVSVRFLYKQRKLSCCLYIYEYSEQ